MAKKSRKARKAAKSRKNPCRKVGTTKAHPFCMKKGRGGRKVFCRCPSKTR